MADVYGVTPAGFSRPRMPEIRRDIVKALRDRLAAAGQSSDVDTRPDSIYGLLIDTFAEREAALWEDVEGVYYAMYPSSASGAALDRAVSFAGVRRLAAEKSRASVILYGVQGTSVPAGSQIRSGATNSLWQTVEDATISAAAASDMTVEVSDLTGPSYTVTVNGTDWTYSGSGTITTVLSGIVTALAPAPGIDASHNGATLRIVATTGNVSISVGARLSIARRGTAVVAETVEAIAEDAAPGDLANMVSLIAGVTAVDNLQSGIAGRNRESDTELRTRYRLGVYRLGAATPPAIEAAVRENVIGVTEARIFENRTDGTVNGMVPHSIRVVVNGGLDADIARIIYATKAAGIDTNGGTEVSLATPQGPQTIKFDRAAKVYIWVKIVLTMKNPNEGEIFPSDGLERIARNALEYGSKLSIGNDVQPQRFYGSVFAVPGIESAVITLDSNASTSHTPSYSGNTVSISNTQIPVFDLARISVT